MKLGYDPADVSLSELMALTRRFCDKIPNSTVEQSLKHLGEELVELAMTLPSYRAHFLEEVSDVILTALIIVIDAQKEQRLGDDLPAALMKKLEHNIASEWDEVSPGKYRRRKP